MLSLPRPDGLAWLRTDLEDIANLQGYIERTRTVLVFCSSGYFFSKNCMIELRSSVMKGKRIQPLLDPEASHGGLTMEAIFDQLVEADSSYAKWGFDDDGPRGEALYAALFADEPVEWNRIGERLEARAVHDVHGVRAMPCVSLALDRQLHSCC